VNLWKRGLIWSDAASVGRAELALVSMTINDTKIRAARLLPIYISQINYNHLNALQQTQFD
jgi:hypothetical protein